MDLQQAVVSLLYIRVCAGMQVDQVQSKRLLLRIGLLPAWRLPSVPVLSYSWRGPDIHPVPLPCGKEGWRRSGHIVKNTCDKLYSSEGRKQGKKGHMAFLVVRYSGYNGFTGREICAIC